MKAAHVLVALFVASCSAPVKQPTVVIVESRSFNDASARGEAKVFATPSPHTKLAAARAWLVVAEALMPTPDASYQAALRGTTELGPDYAGRHVRDDSNLTELSAQEAFAEGRDDSAAGLMVRVLRSRIKMYVRKYASEVE
jgi:hypothetical protein